LGDLGSRCAVKKHRPTILIGVAVRAQRPAPYNGVVSTPCPPLPRRSPSRLLWPAVVVALLGCGEPEAISKYETPRTDERLTALNPDELRASLDHMFTAVVPAGDQAWFFKLVVPGKSADEFRGQFKEFVATVKADDSGDLPSWNLPAGWTLGEAREMVAATIAIPNGDAPLEMTVSNLPLGKNLDDFLEQNVNRWLEQLQQDKRTKAEIKKLAVSTPTAAGEATMFELVGSMQRTAMGMGASGGMPAGHPPVDTSATTSAPQSGEAEADTEDDAASESAAPSSSITYDAPAGWKLGPTNVGGMPREASFLTPGGGEVAVTAWPASGQMADPHFNAMRWAGQVGISDASEESLKKLQSETKVDGDSATLFEFFSPAGVDPAKGIVVAMVVRDDRAWFFKLSGPRAAVEDQQEAFEKFLESVHFAAN
jgi:hypothetical protein